jgi:hypothetical protein
MSDMAKQARKAMKAKAQRLGGDRPMEKVDSSTFTPPEMLNADVKTGMRPISRRAYKSGGKVQGTKGPANMGKSVRSGNKPMTADSMVNKDMKEANQEREGYKHIGGLKSGGRTKKMGGGPLPASIGNAQAMMDRAKATSGVPVSPLASQSRPGVNRFKLASGFKKGGAAKKHDDVKEDMALIKKMVKPSARSGKKEGGFLRTLGDRVAGDVASDEAIKIKDKLLGALSGDNYKKGGRTSKDMGGEADGDDGFKKGGRTARKTGGGVFDGPGYPGKVPGVVPGGRDPHARGGKTGKSKGKTNINIVIGAGKPAGPGDMMGNPMGGPTPPPGMDGMPGGMPIPVPPPSGGPPMPMPMPMPIPMPGPAGPAGPPGMPMPRKAGGRTYRSYKDMDAGAANGFGRLEKAEIASKTARINKGNY